MKEELINLAKKKGFLSIYLLHIDFPEVGALHGIYYYLWMCELQKWIREEYLLYAYVNPYGDPNHSYAFSNIRHLSRSTMENFAINEGLRLKYGSKKFKTYELALETALLESLKLIG